MTAICQNSIVCKEFKSINTSLTPKVMKIYHTIENLSELILQKVSTFYHILTFLGNFYNGAKLSVFNQKGELVQTIFEGELSKGSHSYEFNASDLTSGIYFYKLEVYGQKLQNLIVSLVLIYIQAIWLLLLDELYLK